MTKRNTSGGFVRAVKKSLLSAFLLLSFGAYALENRAAAGTGGPGPSGATGGASDVANGRTGAGQSAAAAPTAAPATAAAPAGAAGAAAAAAPTATTAPSAAPTSAPTAASAPASASSSSLKDGTYTGPVVDVNWGNVQVQTTIRGGKINDVQFVQYPSDRRTSVRINSIADPMLQQEAVQAQSANVDIISGATLTSLGFQQSLQGALSQAKG
jgi:uncharacterized protein with FMN-binding domain